MELSTQEDMLRLYKTLISLTTEYDDELNVSMLDFSGFPSPCEKSDVQAMVRLLQPCIFSLVFILGVLGNGLVLVTYLQHQRLLAMTDVYLLNLASADLLFVFSLPLLAASSRLGWVFGTVLCVLVRMLYKVNLYSGLLLLMCVSVDRYFAIVCATTAHRLRLRHLRYSRHICLLVWVSSFLLCLPELIYTKVERHPNGSTSICADSYPENLDALMRVATPVVQAVLGFLLPLLVMAFCYSVIIKTLLQARNFEKHKAIRVVLAVVLVFVLSQAPYNALLLLRAVGSRAMGCEESKRRDVALQAASCLAYTRCCLNPILYAFVGVKFRNNLARLVRWPWRRADLSAVNSQSRMLTLTDTSSAMTV
ncbi:C-C chemokine receptor type 7-like [Hemitrygon akajei]|uniref:C-C chemokine receptor type 7-like n=1 Tax=Hemitrygon akajei TaxID=2704970 RepID=UPI003BFA0163